MRRLLGRKAVTIIAAIISLTAVPATGIVATATPALASVHICNANGTLHGCIGAPTVNNGDPVVLTASGRDITEVDQHFTYLGFEVYRLRIDASANQSQCVGVAASGNLTLRNCSGGNSSNVNWAKQEVVGGTVWLLNQSSPTEMITSHNQLGQQLFETTGCTNQCWNLWNI
jgi:hypothetical protein